MEEADSYHVECQRRHVGTMLAIFGGSFPTTVYIVIVDLAIAGRGYSILNAYLWYYCSYWGYC